jgi:Leucine-rich repeat (LRR) protein
MANILGKIYDLSDTALFLTNRNITSEMLPDLFVNIGKLTNLKYLNLSDNKITTIPKNIFDNLINLKYLWFARNEITAKGLPENIFDKLTNLTQLYFSNNQISAKDMSENIFNKLTNLTVLSLCNNEIIVKDLPRKIFKRLAKLQHLYISSPLMNEISTRYIRASKEEKLKEKMKLAKLRTAIFKEELYMKTLHYSKINLFDTSYF